MQSRRRERKYSITVFLKAVETSNLPQRGESVLSGALAGRCHRSGRCSAIVGDSLLTLISAVNDIILPGSLVRLSFFLFFLSREGVWFSRQIAQCVTLIFTLIY